MPDYKGGNVSLLTVFMGVHVVPNTNRKVQDLM